MACKWFCPPNREVSPYFDYLRNSVRCFGTWEINFVGGIIVSAVDEVSTMP
jgi:hypothetical protein